MDWKIDVLKMSIHHELKNIINAIPAGLGQGGGGAEKIGIISSHETMEFLDSSVTR